MTGKKAFPWPGVALAATAAVGMLFAGAAFWLVAGVVVLWIGTLMLNRPEPPEDHFREDPAKVSRDAMREIMEPLSQSLILFDGDRIIAANIAARTTLGAHIIGQDARIGLRHPEAMRLLEMPDGGSVTIRGLTGTRSLWQLTRQRIDNRLWLVELIDRTVEADISRAHTDFVANASHELRTPLAAIIGYMETLTDAGDAVDPETAARFQGTVLREARRMQGLVGDLMSLSQLEAEKHDPPTNDIDLAQLTAVVAGEFTSLHGHGRIELERPENEIPVKGDSKQLEQLIRNLIDNAIKYGTPDEPVRVSLSQENGGQAKLSVTDRGAGIAPEHLPHLTRRFYRTDPGRSRAIGGTGLGLAIVKHIVERHRGRLDIESVLGQGTTISIRFAVSPSKLS